MWILWNFLEHLFYGTPLDDCFCDLHFESKILVHFQINILSQNVCSQAIYWVSQKFWKKNGLCDFLLPFASYIWDNVFKNEPSKICGRQPLKNLKWYGLFKRWNVFTVSHIKFIWSIKIWDYDASFCTGLFFFSNLWEWSLVIIQSSNGNVR